LPYKGHPNIYIAVANR